MSLAQRIACLDGISISAALAAATTLWASPIDGSAPWPALGRVAVIVVLCIASFYWNDLYDFEVPHDLPSLFPRLCRAVGIAAVLLALTYRVFPAAIVGANVASHALLAALAAVLAERAAVYALAKREPFAERVVIMGTGALAQALAEQIRGRADLALTLVGFTGDPTPSAPGPWLGGYARIREIVARHRPDRIVVAVPDRRGNLPIAALLACRVRGVRIEEGTEAYERFTRRLAVESLTPSALVFGDGFGVSPAQLALKRALSIIVALVGLVIATPVIAVIALAITLESEGPVFFVQDRIGLGGRPFRVLKFRTMRAAKPAADGVWGRDNDSRVTRVGAFLRTYRLDEIPQFINILRGDMSLVGPRPEMVENVATFSATIPFYDLRHEVRPGLTGWAQVKAGYSMSTAEVTRKLCYDLYYIKHLSVAFDLRILFDTVKFVLSGKRPG
jgi:exopolysaccharide biosynthesis polyprenyl glycosylphosphotransferase